MRRTVLVAVLTVLPFLPAVPALGDIVIDPMRIVFDAPPGAVEEGTIRVTNVGEYPTSLSVQRIDFFFDPQGGLVPLEPGTLGGASLNPALEFTPTSLSLNPQETGLISYRIQLPPESTGSHWAGLVIQEEEPQTSEEETEGIVVRTEFRIAYVVCLYQNPPGRLAEPWIRVAEMDTVFVPPQETEAATEQQERVVRVSITVENLTDVVLTPTGWMEVRDSTGATVDGVEVHSFVLLPHAQLSLIVQFVAEDWKEGAYLAVAMLDAGGETLAAGQAIVEIPPP